KTVEAGHNARRDGGGFLVSTSQHENVGGILSLRCCLGCFDEGSCLFGLALERDEDDITAAIDGEVLGSLTKASDLSYLAEVGDRSRSLLEPHSRLNVGVDEHSVVTLKISHGWLWMICSSGSS